MLITALVILGLILALLSNRFRASYVFVTALTALYLSGEIEQSVILSNITNYSVFTLLLLLLSALVLERTLLLNWASKHLAHPSYTNTLLRLGVVGALSSAFLNNTAVVSSLMNAVLKNPFHSPKRLLIPLSYFSILGGTLTLIGTATNLVVNGLLEAQGLESLDVFDFFPVGICLLLGCGVVIFFTSQCLPKEREQEINFGDYFLDAEVRASSKLIGKTVLENGLRSLDALFLVEVIRGGRVISPVSPSEILHAQDILIFSGDVSEVKQLLSFDGLQLYVEEDINLHEHLTEVLVSPESILVGKTLKQIEFRSRFDAAVVAISRQGEKLSGKLGECIIHSGDKLILSVGDDFKKRSNLSRNFFLLDNWQVKTPLTTEQNMIGIGGFLLAIVLAAVTPLNLIDTLSAFIIVSLMTNIVDTAHLRRHFPFELLIILISALCIANAFSTSGLAISLSQSFQSVAGELSLDWVLVGTLVFTVLLTEVMTNTAAVAIMFPIALALAHAFNVHYLPLVMAVAYGASASFISPFGYQTNLMVMNAGNYRVQNFIKVGWLVTLAYIAIASLAIPYFFPF